jgi:hypothetical protein
MFVDNNNNNNNNHSTFWRLAAAISWQRNRPQAVMRLEPIVCKSQ